DQNGVELYWDKPEAEWPRGPDGKLAMVNARVDLKELLNQATI
ncbi:MAG: glyoxalase, partial [Aestuariivirga sp.]